MRRQIAPRPDGSDNPFVPMLAKGAGVAIGLLWLLWPATAFPSKITLKDGRVLEGRIGMVAGVAEDPNRPAKRFGEVDVQPVLILDNGLTRTFVAQRQVTSVVEAGPAPRERIRLRQPVARSGLKIGSVGPIGRITPFDEFGRRLLSMTTTRGVVDIVQGITEITPVYCKVEGLLGGKRPYVWDMRVATSTLPRKTLRAILSHTGDGTKSDHRLKVVRLLLQSERYEDARQELEQVVTEFPELKELREEVRSLTQLGARRLLTEIQLRRAAGQHRFTQGLLANFPAEGVAGETLAHVREIEDQTTAKRKRIAEAVSWFDRELARLGDPPTRQRIAPIRDEIVAELSIDTLDRMTPFLRLADDKTLSARQKLAIAISGWLVGSNQAIENLPVVLSLFEVRNAVRDYLRQPDQQRRSQILSSLRSQEGATPAQVARLLAHMKPPLEVPSELRTGPGFYQLSVPGLVGEPDVRYLVQVPPEYDPHRRYPAILTLNGAASSPKMQIDWWAGAPDKNGSRSGQAMRHGYLVIAVEWQKPYQREYKYSAREHHAVLASLRDACRHFSIDTDRVFLSGHDVGGDAAWDLGLAHPDQWAGVIPVVAVADRYCSHYWPNARYVPFYVVAGELDGDRLRRNARDLDRYFLHNFDATLVEYLGRGHEHFFGEIGRLLDWMGRRHRNFFPRDFHCATMRQWDNYFWWLELNAYPTRSIVDPSDWPPPRGTRALKVSGSIKPSGSIVVRSGSQHVTLWLAPEIVDFQKRINITLDGRRLRGDKRGIRPTVQVLLEDVRTRGDRQHPFWAKVESR
ncbi:MAG: peptidase [Pirellulales bacterium]